MFNHAVATNLSPGFCLIGPIGTGELLIILFLVILFFGPRRLPEVAEAIGKSIRRFKQASRDVTTEIESQEDKNRQITQGKDKLG